MLNKDFSNKRSGKQDDISSSGTVMLIVILFIGIYFCCYLMGGV